MQPIFVKSMFINVKIINNQRVKYIKELKILNHFIFIVKFLYLLLLLFLYLCLYLLFAVIENCIKYKIMGQENTTLKSNNSAEFTMNNYVKIAQKHHQKVFESKKKSKKQFEEFMQTIRVRLAYLKYNWAKKLRQVLKDDRNELYDEYCSVLITNCHKKGKQEQVFHPKQIQQIFINEFTSKYCQKQQKIISEQQVQEALQECKCFFMMIKWLKEIVSFNEESYQKGIKQNLIKGKNNSENKFNQKQQKIYNLLMLLLENYYDDYLFDVSVAPNQKIQKQKIQLNTDILRILKLLLKQNTFKEKEYVINILIKLIQKEESQNISSMYQKVIKVCSIKKAYCMIRLIKQVGDIQIGTVWKEVQKVTKKRAQSPSKRQRGKKIEQKQIISMR